MHYSKSRILLLFFEMELLLNLFFCIQLKVIFIMQVISIDSLSVQFVKTVSVMKNGAISALNRHQLPGSVKG